MEDHGEGLTEEVLTSFLGRPIDLMIRADGSQVGVTGADGTICLPPTADESLDRLSRLSEPGLTAMRHLARRQAEHEGFDLDALFGR